MRNVRHSMAPHAEIMPKNADASEHRYSRLIENLKSAVSSLSSTIPTNSLRDAGMPMVKMVWDTDSGDAARSVASQYCKRPMLPDTANRIRIWASTGSLAEGCSCSATVALAVNQSQQLLLEADIRFRAHQHLEMLAIVGDVLADTFDDMLDAGRIRLREQLVECGGDPGHGFVFDIVQ